MSGRERQLARQSVNVQRVIPSARRKAAQAEIIAEYEAHKISARDAYLALIDYGMDPGSVDDALNVGER